MERIKSALDGQDWRYTLEAGAKMLMWIFGWLTAGIFAIQIMPPLSYGVSVSLLVFLTLFGVSSGYVMFREVIRDLRKATGEGDKPPRGA